MQLAEYIKPLNINGLAGRVLYLPPPQNKRRNMILLYGHHSSIERLGGVAEYFNQYGSVTVPDFPGFGGMDSFYRIGMKPTIDNFADYLAATIKLRFKKQKITIVGMSFGFVVVTRMLQRYPAMADQVDLLVSAVGFAHKDDYAFKSSQMIFFRWMSRFLGMRLPAAFFRNVCLNPSVLRLLYAKMPNARNKFKDISAAEAKRAMDFEVVLWRINEVRTYWHVAYDMLTLDNCGKRIELPVEHITVDTDQYFNHSVVEQHMRVIFSGYREHLAHMKAHAPSIIANKAEAEGLVPLSIRKLLNKDPQQKAPA